MAYQKRKEERYSSFGGMNTKISQYLNGPMEFLNLQNVDFQILGSLTKRWGSTQYFGASLSGKVNGLYEFTQVSGSSYFYAAAGGTLGLCLSGGFSAIFSGSTAGTSYFSSFGSSFVDGISLASQDLDFETLQNNMFMANGSQFFKSTGGSSFVFFGLPRFRCATFSQLQVSGTSFYQGSNAGTTAGFTGLSVYKLAWVNSYGMAGAPNLSTDASWLSYYFGASSNIISVHGASGGFGLVPPNYDITGIAVFRSDPVGVDLVSGFTLSLNPSIISDDFGATTYLTTFYENLNYKLAGVVGVSAGSVAATFLDTNYAGGITLINKNILPWDWYAQKLSIGPAGVTTNPGFGVTLIPRFIEAHQNRIFMAGMSYALSTYFWSDVPIGAEPEHFEADFGTEVRTNNGEAISALKSYNGNLIIFKPSSFHQLSFTNDPLDGVLSPISTDYGCLGNRAVCTYANLLVFLDRKGVLMYNGSNIQILSHKIDPIFQRMNVFAASGAQLTYDKQRNQILCDIPVDGATMNNFTVVYDMTTQEQTSTFTIPIIKWTTYQGYNPAVSAIAHGQLPLRQVFYGGYSGLVSYFGPSFTTDNGSAFTCIIKSGFLTDLGNSTQKVFRRLWMDASPAGASSAVDVHLYQDYGASIIVSTTMFQNPFQSRIDFGVSAKSLSVEFVMGSTYSLALHGFAIAYRFQRNV